MEERTLTFGEKAVGLSFNPSGERRRMLSIAITEAQTAQMWAVKAATWSD